MKSLQLYIASRQAGVGAALPAVLAPAPAAALF
jgi:hypothetical protein